MKTLNTENAIKCATERMNKYVEGLKHGVSFKYVKGISNSYKTLANILLERQNNGEMGVKLTNEQLEAFGMDKNPNGNGFILYVDVRIIGKKRPQIIILDSF